MEIERLRELRTQAEAATPGPWEIDSDHSITIYAGSGDITIADIPRQRGTAYEANATLLIGARQNTLDLLDYIDLLHKVLAEAHDESVCYRDGYRDGQRATQERVLTFLSDCKDDPSPNPLDAPTVVFARLLNLLAPVPYQGQTTTV